jgi:signal transduction histidine kinase
MVEDSRDDAELLVRELTRAGYSVTSERVDTADGMKTALDRQGWDLVICDYSMPHFSGLDALRLLRARSLDTPFIFLSGTIGEETAVAALKQGAQDYVMKGNLKRLVPAIQRELEESERRKERAHLEQRIRHLERFEAIGKLAGGIAHDFNNVIGVILGSAQLGEQQAPEQTARERFRTIRSQAELAGNLTRQLLAFARRQVLQPEKVDLNRSISRISSVLQSGIGERIELKTNLDPDIHIIDADPTQIEQVLLNLGLNARDAMPQGGNLLFGTSNVVLDDDFCRSHSYGRPGSYVMLTVSDTGLGMDASTQEHIFEPFFTTKELGKGTGLGLATVYGIVKQHGGFINVYSELGRGTTFRVYFPSSWGHLETKAEAAAAQSATGTETILVAEDNAALGALAEEVLSSQGYRVIVAKDGTEAVRLFSENPERFALVFLDVVMPKLGGPEAFSQMIAIRPNLPVIFASGHAAETASLNSTMPTGAVFLQKPYMPQSLAESVRAVLDRKQKT